MLSNFVKGKYVNLIYEHAFFIMLSSNLNYTVDFKALSSGIGGTY